eukprot:scaffold1740_cov254-Pinguiococcus_pyrenoidosus.AAC.21
MQRDGSFLIGRHEDRRTPNRRPGTGLGPSRRRTPRISAHLRSRSPGRTARRLPNRLPDTLSMRGWRGTRAAWA